jgi:hypothetical protein
MPSKETVQVSDSERVQNSYKQLNSAAAELNNASDELKEAMSVLDAALKRLNLGISVWVQISGNDDGQGGEWWDRRIGYSKIGKEWCIGLASCRGHYQWPDQDHIEEWSFSDAPRWMRIEAAGKVPELLEALVKQAQETTSKMKKRTEQVFELGVAMSKVLDEIEGQKKAGGNA